MENLPESSGHQVRRAAQAGTTIARRKRNARGQGTRLTEEIVSGALSIIEREGDDEAVTLRAVAREIGIAAPSIYAHFQDRDAIVVAAVARVFDQLAHAILEAVEGAGDDPAERLIAGCEAYVAFGLGRPARYRVLFSEQRLANKDYCKPVAFGPDGRPVLEFGAESFALLVEALAACVAADKSTSTDVVADSTAIWVAMHGTVSLQVALPGFPWPEPDSFVRQLVMRLGLLRPVPPSRTVQTMGTREGG
jgi:AcrR family transcriptional regulator